VKTFDAEIAGLKEQVALQGLELGAIDVGEASSMMYKGKDPANIPLVGESTKKKSALTVSK